ncbi:uncharacterized protein LOC134224439 [Armigeres subalbatus]|uniref:uncharacterized protein LOC134224439 n=1 Tax=Armigeres subalbatus TaxID=124917 RepID=UPI002ED41A5D
MTETGGNRNHSGKAGKKRQACNALANLDSSSDEETGYVSPYCCSSDDDNDQSTRQILDELPAFSTQSLSPSGRSLSPIDMDTSPPRSSRGASACNTPYDSPCAAVPSCGKDYVTLEEIQARIGLTPPEPEQSPRSPRLNLETIFEDKFLETPPKGGKEFDTRTNHNLLRRSFRNRVQLMGAMGDGGVLECGGISPMESLSQQFQTKVMLD